MYTSFEGFLWTPWLTIFHQCLTDLKEQVTIPAFTIRKETQIIGMSHNLVQRFDSFFAKPSILLATISCPNKSTCPLHQEYRPSKRLIRGNIPMHFCIRLISFYHYG